MTIPYNPASPKTEEFINHQEILDTLAFADERSKDLDYCRSLLEKARTLKGLTHREASVLLACEDPSILEGIYDLPGKSRTRSTASGSCSLPLCTCPTTASTAVCTAPTT